MDKPARIPASKITIEDGTAKTQQIIGDIFFECPSYIVLVNQDGNEVTIPRRKIVNIER